MAVDPYSKWLGLPPGARPPKAHQLLGLPAETTDLVSIDQAAARCMDRLDQFALSNDPATCSEVQQLMNEVAKARTEMVRGQRDKPEASPQRHPSAQSSKPAAPTPSKPSPRKRKVRPKQPRQQVPEAQPPEPSSPSRRRPDDRRRRRTARHRRKNKRRASTAVWIVYAFAFVLAGGLLGLMAFIMSGSSPIEQSNPQSFADAQTSRDRLEPTSDDRDPEGTQERTPADETEAEPQDEQKSGDGKPPEQGAEALEQPAASENEAANGPQAGSQGEGLNPEGQAALQNLVKRFLNNRKPSQPQRELAEIQDPPFPIAKPLKGQALQNYIQQRDQLPPEEQVEVIRYALAEMNGVRDFELDTKIVDGVITELSLKAHGDARPVFKDISALTGLKLQRLGIYYCSGITRLDALKGMPLAELNLRNNRRINDLSGLQGMPLKKLYLSDCPVKGLGPLRGAPLSNVYFGNCPQLKAIGPLAGAPIRYLTFDRCKNLRDLSAISQMSELQTVMINQVPKPGLQNFRGKKMWRLDIRNCPGLTTLDGLDSFEIGVLNIDSQRDLKDVSALANIQISSRLSLASPSVEAVAIMPGSRLEQIELRCKNLKSIKGLEYLRNLKQLDLTSCPALNNGEVERIRQAKAGLTIGIKN